ncbi:hypothetical protein B0181_10750 [Moraxella caviae]|uniref:Uncharacterized protein n=1 Tax=Moraxella caviae TaxID=34060 RepID=A0A1S9ZUS6_9GAMM|nr:hypothetical protein [Moraxella caviae]OOR87262.1 hypothetical protein B0181_10750 [Moraxella caviae]STZ14800.1 Uncharacterised protein [Moraxella caviae]
MSQLEQQLNELKSINKALLPAYMLTAGVSFGMAYVLGKMIQGASKSAIGRLVLIMIVLALFIKHFKNINYTTQAALDTAFDWFDLKQAQIETELVKETLTLHEEKEKFKG